MPSRIEAICDLLLAAAHSNERFVGREIEMIKKMMCALQRTETLEPSLEKRIDSTDPDGIDIMETAALFDADSEEDKRHLMQLVAAVHQVDGKYDAEEDEMTIFIAAALGFNTAQITELSKKAQDDALQTGYEALTGQTGDDSPT